MLVKCTYILLAFALNRVGAQITCYKCSSRFGTGTVDCGKVVNETLHPPITCDKGEICMLEISIYPEGKHYSRDCQSKCVVYSSNMLSRKCCSEDRCNAEPLKCYGCSSKLDEGCGHVVDPNMQDPNSCDDMDACLLEENKESAEHIYFRYCAKACEPIKSANRTKRCCMDDLCNSGANNMKSEIEIIYIETNVTESNSILILGLVIGALALLIILILVGMSCAINKLRKQAPENTQEIRNNSQRMTQLNNNEETHYEYPVIVSDPNPSNNNRPRMNTWSNPSDSADRPPPPPPSRINSAPHGNPGFDYQSESPYPSTRNALAQT